MDDFEREHCDAAVNALGIGRWVSRDTTHSREGNGGLPHRIPPGGVNEQFWAAAGDR
jgi:hypothetical protein